MRGTFFAGLWRNPKPFFLTITQRLNIDMKPKEVLIEAVNKFLKESSKRGYLCSPTHEKAKGRTYW